MANILIKAGSTIGFTNQDNAKAKAKLTKPGKYVTTQTSGEYVTKDGSRVGIRSISYDAQEFPSPSNEFGENFYLSTKSILFTDDDGESLYQRTQITIQDLRKSIPNFDPSKLSIKVKFDSINTDMTKELCSLSVDSNGILSGFPYCATNWSPTKGNSWTNQRVSCIPYYDGKQLAANGIVGYYTIHSTKNYTSEYNRPALDPYPRFIPYKSKACRILVGDAEIYSDSVSVHRLLIGPKFTDNPIQYPMMTAFFLPINAALPVRMTNMESGPMFVGLYRYDSQIVANGKPLTDRIWSVRINSTNKELRKNHTWMTLKKNSVYFLIALHKNHTPSNLMNQLLGTTDMNKLPVDQVY